MNTGDAVSCVTPAMFFVPEIQADFYSRSSNYEIWDPLGSSKDFVPRVAMWDVKWRVGEEVLLADQIS